MSVTDLVTDTHAHTLTVTAEFTATPERVWELWSDPRKLERWWGPPGYPATFVAHDLTPGGETAYYMTGPDGVRYHGWWRIIETDAPVRLRLVDGFADDEGNPNSAMPESTMTLKIESVSDALTRMTITTQFASAEAMGQLIGMGMEEGLRAALGQIPGILAEAD